MKRDSRCLRWRAILQLPHRVLTPSAPSLCITVSDDEGSQTALPRGRYDTYRRASLIGMSNWENMRPYVYYAQLPSFGRQSLTALCQPEALLIHASIYGLQCVGIVFARVISFLLLICRHHSDVGQIRALLRSAYSYTATRTTLAPSYEALPRFSAV